MSRRRRLSSRWVAGLVVVALVGAVTVIVNSASAGPTNRATIVLDPDDNVAHAAWPGVGTVTELSYNVRLADEVKSRLEANCKANVVVTRDASRPFVSRDERKATAVAAAPDFMVTLAFNALTGSPWGVFADGGPRIFARPQDVGLGEKFRAEIPAFTGRNSTLGVSTAHNQPLYSEYDDLAFPYAHVEALFLDHNYDWPVIDSGFGLIADGVTAGIQDQMSAMGLSCSKYPSRPSAAELLRLRNLGYQNYQRYGADPISMSTGNFVTSESTVKLTGVGDQVIDTTLHYNAQSGRDSQVGFGWSFEYGGFVQLYDDDSAAVVLADGRTFVFEPDGAGGYKAPDGSFASLTAADATTLRWSSNTGETATFTLDTTSGYGAMQSTTDRQGNTIRLEYAGAGSTFARLSAIVDQAGQRVAVETDNAGRIAALVRPDGARWELGYNDAADLVALRSPGGKVRRYVYDGAHHLTEEVGADGVTYLTNTYDDGGRVVRQTNSMGGVRTLTFDDQAKTTTYKDVTGAVTTYFWDEVGRITKVIDPTGAETTTAYDNASQATTDRDALGGTTTREFDPATGKVTKTTDPTGAEILATYTPQGDATSITDHGGPAGATRTTSFVPNADGLPTEIVNPDGTVSHNTYSDAGDLLTATDEMGNTYTFGYDDRGNRTTVTDPRGGITLYAFDTANRQTSVTDAVGNTTRYTYDADDNVTTVAYPNGSTEQFDYDANNQVVRYQDQRGAVTGYRYDDELNLVDLTLPNGGHVTFTFDGENRLTSVTDAEGGVTKYELDRAGRQVVTIDPNGNRTKTGYDPAGNVIEQIDPTGAATAITRDPLGRATAVRAPDSGVTAFEYDQVGRTTKVTDPTGSVTKLAYNFRDQLVKLTDPTNFTETHTFDAAGREIATTDRAGAVTKFEVDANGNRTATTDPLGGRTDIAYDANNHVVAATDPNRHTTRFTLDSMSQLVGVTNPLGQTTTMIRDNGGLVTSVTDPLAHTRSIAYDSMRNQVAVTDPLGRVTRTAWDRNDRKVAATAADGVLTAYGHDRNGNLTTVTENAKIGAPPSADTNVTTSYQYDSRNLLTGVVDANGGRTTFGLDAVGRILTETNPLGNVTTNSYTAAGDLALRKDANGVVTLSSYSPRHELTRRSFSNGQSETYEYDANGNQTVATNHTGTVTTAFDALNRPAATTDAARKTLKFGYDAAGNRTSLTLPDGATIAGGYDAANRNTTITSPLGNVTVGYDASGRPTTVTKPNGTITTAAYDAGDELTNLATVKGTNTLASFGYTFTANGDVQSRVSTIGSSNRAEVQTLKGDGKGDHGPNPTTATTNYSYDALRRLTQSTGTAGTYSYTYDPVGNLTRTVGTDDPATAKPNDRYMVDNTFNLAGQLTNSTTSHWKPWFPLPDTQTTYTYDPNGNRVSAQTSDFWKRGHSTETAYSYTVLNQLEAAGPANKRHQVCGRPGIGNDGCPPGLNKTDEPGNSGHTTDHDQEHPSNTLTRTYDALGRVVTEGSGRATTTWTHDGLDPVVATTPKNTTTYLRDGFGDLLGEQTKTGSPEWYIADALGSIIGSTDTNGRLDHETTSYTDYGVQTSDSDFRFGYTGERSDPTGNGLLNFYARTYDPNSTNWLQADPYRGQLDQPDTLTRYQYVTDNPASLVDFYGYWGWSNITKFVSDHKKAIVTIAVGVAVGACVAGTAGLCGGGLAILGSVAGLGGAVLTGAVAGGLGGAAGAGAGYLVGSGKKSVGGFIQTTLKGGLYGALSGAATGGLLYGAGRLLSGVGLRSDAAYNLTRNASEGEGLRQAERSLATESLPNVKAGSAGGPTAGKAFPQSVKDAALAENPSTCVYCGMETGTPQVDHAIPKVQGGDAILENAQTTCAWCNASKGGRDVPVNPPPGYVGPWPPPWWLWP